MHPEANEAQNKKDIAVKVAVRIRPLIPKEIAEGCGECLDVYQEKQVNVNGANKAYTFDHSFSPDISQQYMYEKCVRGLIKKLFAGYNVTILAYGQTGSGKTHSMGTTFVSNVDSFSDAGIIPRAVTDIFKGIEERSENIRIRASFIELYKEALYDLLHLRTREEAVVDIREDPKEGIRICGLTELEVVSLEDALKCLEKGAKNRVTGSTAMNSQSSRSHAIFTLHLEINSEGESDTKTAKFHLVDLAGSERAKKTQATGERFKEGVNINKGLLALGNVISALCVEGPRGYIPYRDSKLTRLLQDSLGGNSHCLMLACVSPADSNLEETLSTLRYADRAKKIQNKPMVNMDPRAQEVATLKKQIQELRVQLISAGVCSSEQEGGASPAEITKLQKEKQELEEENDKLTKALHVALDENMNMAEKAIMAEMAGEQMKKQLEELSVQTGNTVDVMNKSLADVASNSQSVELLSLVKNLQMKIQSLKDDQSKREKAIVDHELSRHSIATNTTAPFFVSGDDKTHSTDQPEIEESPIKGDFGTGFTLKQAKMNEELSAINRALAMKEELINKMTTSDSHMQHLNQEQNKVEYEERIAKLMKEKEQLMSHQTHDLKSRKNSSKIAEQRRKRVQELEVEISSLKKKLLEQSKLLTIKGKSEEKVNQLNAEIRSMKATRVNLIRQMKEDNEKFRKWKAQKNREVEKLKLEDRKKQFQIVKMERLHCKQQNVLKRKIEQANAVNKRMMDAMALQKAALQKRMASKDMGNLNARMKEWLDGEMEVVSAKKQAKKGLETLKEERKNICDKLSKIKNKIENNELTPFLHEGLKKSKENLENELQMRTAQIADIQTKLLDDDEENTVKTIVDSVKTMVEMRCAMSHLFKIATCSQAQTSSLENELKDMNAQIEESYQLNQQLEADMKRLEEDFGKKLDKISREHEEKVLFILRQMPSIKNVEPESTAESGEKNINADLVQRLKLQEAELERFSHMNELLQHKMTEVDDLQKRLDDVQMMMEKGKLSVTAVALKEKDDNKIETSRIKRTGRMSQKVTVIDPVSSEEEDKDKESDTEDRIIDPDWVKTPLYKRIKQISNRKNRRVTGKTVDINVENNTEHATKRRKISKEKASNCSIEDKENEHS